MKVKKWVLRRLRVLLSVFVSAVVLAPAAPFRAAAMEGDSGASVRKANQVVLDDGPESTQAPPLEKTIPVNNAVVPDEEENTNLDTVVTTKNMVTKDEGEPESDILEETVPLSDMVVPIEGEDMPSDHPDNPFLDILVPGDISFILDPYNILGQGTVISEEYVFENKSGMDILVNLESFEYIPPGEEEVKKTKTAEMDSDDEMDLRFTSNNLNLVDYEQWLSLFPEEEPESEPQPREGEAAPEGAEPEQKEEAAADSPEPTGEPRASGKMDAVDSEPADELIGSMEPGSPEPKPEEGVPDSASGAGPADEPAETGEPQSAEKELPEEEPSASVNPEPSSKPDPVSEEEEKIGGGDEIPEDPVLCYRHSGKNEIAMKKDGSSPLVFALMGEEEKGENRAVFRIKGTASPDSELAIAQGGRVRLVFSCIPFDGILTDVKNAPEPEPESGDEKGEKGEKGETTTDPIPNASEPVPSVPPEPESGNGAMEGGPSPTPAAEEEAGNDAEETGEAPSVDPGMPPAPTPLLPEESKAPPAGDVNTEKSEEPEAPSASGGAIQT